MRVEKSNGCPRRFARPNHTTRPRVQARRPAQFNVSIAVYIMRPLKRVSRGRHDPMALARGTA